MLHYRINQCDHLFNALSADRWFTNRMSNILCKNFVKYALGSPPSALVWFCAIGFLILCNVRRKLLKMDTRSLKKTGAL